MCGGNSHLDTRAARADQTYTRASPTAASETLPALEQRLAERLLAFELLDEAWPRGRTAIERAESGWQREDALSGIVALRDRIVTSRAETLADAAAQLRRLEVMAEENAAKFSRRKVAIVSWSGWVLAATKRTPISRCVARSIRRLEKIPLA